MSTTNFTDGTTIIYASWLNDVDAVVWDILGGPTTLAAFWTAIGPTPGPIGGTTPDAGTFTTLTSTSYTDIGNGGHSFTVAGAALNGKLSIHDDSATDVLGVTIERHENTTAAFGAHFVGARTRGTEASPTVVQSGDLITRFLGLGFDGTDYGTAGEIKIEVDGTPGAGDMPGRIVFETTPDGTETMVERMRITNGGLVGIGTGSATPDGKLHVMTASAGTVTADADADDIVVENNTNSGVSILSPNASFSSIYFGSPIDNLGAQFSYSYSAVGSPTLYVGTGIASGELILRSGNSVEAMVIDGSQNVTINGTASTNVLTIAATSGSIAYSGGGNNAIISSGTLYLDNTNASGAIFVRPYAQHKTFGFFNYAAIVGNIGSVIPDGTLHVYTASAGTVTASTSGDDLVVENSGSGGLSILTPAASDGSVIWGSPTSNAYASIVGNNTAGTLSIKYGATAAQTIDSGLNVAVGTAAIATTATDGFLYIPTCAGAPTGTPTSKTGLAPMVYDSTNNKFWMYDGGWIGVALA